jgi:hypothetical protein
MPDGFVPWESVALSTRYRSLDPFEKQKIRDAWLREQADPFIFKGQLLSNRNALIQMQNYQNSFNLPAPLPDEDTIITPNTLNMDGYSAIERNTVFARKPYAEQKELMRIWYTKMGLMDQNFRKLSPEQQQRFGSLLMERPPASALSATLRNGPLDSPYTDAKKAFINAERGAQDAESYIQQFVTSFNKAGTAITGPIAKWLGDTFLGKEGNFLSSMYTDMEQQNDWKADISNATNPLPSFVGGMLGTIASPFPKVEKALSGAIHLPFKGAKALEVTPGILEAIGTKAGLKLPSLTYGIAGGTLAGMLQGVGMSMLEDKPWNTYLAQDAIGGAAFELITRYIGGVRNVRKLMSTSGYKGTMKDFLHAPLKVGIGSDSLAEQMRALIKSNQLVSYLVGVDDLVDKSGVLYQLYNSKRGIEMRANILGYKINDTADRLELVKDNSVKEVWNKGSKEAQYIQAGDWLDVQEVDWQRVTTGKTIRELLNTAQTVELYTGSRVPEQARNKMLEVFDQHNINLPLNYKDDPIRNSALVDSLYRVVMAAKSAPEAERALRARGIDLGMGVEGEEGVRDATINVAQLRRDLRKLQPSSAYFIYDSKTNTLVRPENIPQVLIDSALFKDPKMYKNIWTGSFDKLRNALSTLKSRRISDMRKATRLAKTNNIELRRLEDNSMVELVARIPDETGNINEIAILFDSYAKAHNFARGYGKEAFKETFGNDPAMYQSYKSFTKEFAKKDRAAFNKDFLPYRFLSKEARDKGYYLGVYKGRYIVQDILGGPALNAKHYEFNSLGEVSQWLKGNDPREVLDDLFDLTPEVHNYMSDVIDPMLDPEPMRGLEPLPVKQKKFFGAALSLSMALKPTQWVMEAFERLPFGRALAEAGMGPDAMHNMMRTGVNTSQAWSRTYVNAIHDIGKGFDEDMADYARRWWEGLADPNEPRTPGLSQETKAEVEELMKAKFGDAKTVQIIEAATKIHSILEELFHASGVDPSTYLNHYMTVLRQDVNTALPSLAAGIDVHKSIDQLPRVNKPAMFEFLRGADINDVAREKNIFRLSTTYVHLAARKRWIQPVLEQIKTHIKQVAKSGVLKGKDTDYEAFTRYISGIFDAVNGSIDHNSRIHKSAIENTINNIRAKLNMPPMARRTSVVDGLTTLVTGGYIAGRPFSVIKQLTQSLVTGMPMIGTRQWLLGLDKLMRPGAIEELVRRGVITPGELPIGSGFALQGNTLLQNAVRVGMTPFEIGDWINRAIVYYGMEDKIGRAVNKFLVDGNQARFIKRSGIQVLGRAQINTARHFLEQPDIRKGINGFVDFAAKAVVEKSQFLYNKFEHPSLFRSGIGKLFGTFASYPLNMLSMLKDVWSNDAMSVAQKAKFLASLGIVSSSMAIGFRAAGIRGDDLYPWNSVMFQGGPYYQMMNDLLGALGGEQSRWQSFTRALVSLVPYSRAGDGVMKAVDAIQRGQMYEALLHLASAPVILRNGANSTALPDVVNIEQYLNEAGKQFFAGKEYLETVGGSFPNP